jgi:hypothetical protein
MPKVTHTHWRRAPKDDIHHDRMIITLVAATEALSIAPDVLIRADGMPWPLEVPALLRGTTGGHQHKLLLIDLCDDLDEVSAKATRSRIADYQRRGWEMPKVRQFLEREALE